MDTYQIRDNFTGKLMLEESSPELLIKFLTRRNPSSFIMFRLKGFGYEVSQVISADQWLQKYQSH